MEINLFESLAQRSADPKIRWPGSEVMKEWTNCREYAAIAVELTDVLGGPFGERPADSTALGELAISNPFYALETDTDGPGISRFALSRLLLRELMKHLHGDSLEIVVSDEPQIKNKIRSYKGLIEKETRSFAKSFEQVESEYGCNGNVIYNRVTIDSLAPARCLIYLGDTFKAFGYFRSLASASNDLPLHHLAFCYEMQFHRWQWSIQRLLPVICRGQESLVFLQGVASTDTLELVTYLPSDQVRQHLMLLQDRFDARIEKSQGEK